MKTKSVFLLLILLAFAGHAPAQSSAKHRRDSLRALHNKQDTNYVRKYPDRLIITLYQSTRQYDVRFSQTLLEDTGALSKHQYMADANLVTGAAIDLDKISVSFSLKSRPSTPADVKKKGRTNYGSFSLSFNAYRFRVETSYRKYQGFYDLNSPRYISSFNDTTPYFHSPMNVLSLRAKTLFIFNKRRFSYNAAYSNTYRQVKSAGSWLGAANVYWYGFSSDTSLFPMASRFYYDRWGYLNRFNMLGISLGPGASYNLVLFKLLYLNLTLTAGLDMQHQAFFTDVYGNTLKRWRPGFASDFRAALGFNSRNFFISLVNRIDYNSYAGPGFVIEPRFISGEFNIGYRFPLKKRKWMIKVQENKWYKKL